MPTMNGVAVVKCHRALVNLLESVRQVIADAKAKRACELWSLDCQQIWPLQKLKVAGLTKITAPRVPR